MPRIMATREMVSGFNGLDAATDAGVSICTPLLIERSAPAGTLKSAVTWDGFGTCPGTTSANASRRLCGFCTMPTTCRSTPPTFHAAPTERWKAEATPLVTATW